MDHVRNYLADLGIPAADLRLFTREPQPTYLFEVPGNAAIEVWDALLKTADDNGLSPVILGETGEARRMADNLEICHGVTPDDIIERSLELDVPVWLDRRREESDTAEPDGEDDWPDDVEPHGQLTGMIDDQTGDPYPAVTVALVPTPASWESAAYLRFGNWNQCPSPDEHVAVWRRWNQLYGAEIICMTNDVIEARIARPPADREAAMTLALEQYAYCTDIVDQGVGSVLSLAAVLLDGPTWFFWWD
jgi:hypothetical protein